MGFNRMTTVHWQHARVAEPLEATSRLLKLIGNAVRSAGGYFAYIWVRENGVAKGEHVHILWHGPADFPAYRKGNARWLMACGAEKRRGVSHTRAIGFSTDHVSYGDGAYCLNLAEALDYVLKGAEQQARARYGIKRCEPGGNIIGKRCGVSINIGPTARKVRPVATVWGGA